MSTLTCELTIAAPPEVVFSFFTDAERFKQWQGQEAELDPRPGGIFRVRMTGVSNAIVSGEYIELVPHSRIVYTFGWENARTVQGAIDVPPGASRVEVTLTPDGPGTRLRLRHSGLPSEAALAFHRFGWDHSLPRLATAAAGGDPGPDMLAAM